MQSTFIELATCAVAAWAWILLLQVARRHLFTVIYIQQRMGVRTPKSLYWLLDLQRWLIAVGIACAAVAALVPELRQAIALGVLAAAIVLLTFAYAGMTRLLNPRLVNFVFEKLRGDGPDGQPPEPSPVTNGGGPNAPTLAASTVTIDGGH